MQIFNRVLPQMYPIPPPPKKKKPRKPPGSPPPCFFYNSFLVHSLLIRQLWWIITWHEFCEFICEFWNHFSCSHSLILIAVWFQEPLHLRNRELLVLKAQLQRRVEELQREVDIKSTRSSIHTPPRVASPVHSWSKCPHQLILHSSGGRKY